MQNQKFSKNKKESLDWVSSANFAELNLRLNVALTFWTLDGAFNFWKDVFRLAEFFSEDLVVE